MLTLGGGGDRICPHFERKGETNEADDAGIGKRSNLYGRTGVCSERPGADTGTATAADNRPRMAATSLRFTLRVAVCGRLPNMLLPAGRLREPLSALWRADVVFLTKADLLSTDALTVLRRKVEECLLDVPVVPVYTR